MVKISQLMVEYPGSYDEKAEPMSSGIEPCSFVLFCELLKTSGLGSGCLERSGVQPRTVGAFTLSGLNYKAWFGSQGLWFDMQGLWFQSAKLEDWIPKLMVQVHKAYGPGHKAWWSAL